MMCDDMEMTVMHVDAVIERNGERGTRPDLNSVPCCLHRHQTVHSVPA
jgi:hypothetical protein